MPRPVRKHDANPAPTPFRFTPDTGRYRPISRHALLNRFQRAPERSVFLLHAPAGFGKTYVLAEWAKHARRRGHAVAWLNLGPAEQEPLGFACALADALRLAGLKGVPHLTASTCRKLEARTGSEALLACIARQPRPVFFVLDSYDRAAGDVVHAFLQSAVAQTPHNLTLALACRETPRISMARLLLEGRLERLDKTALALSLAETQVFFGNALSAQEIRAAYDLTEGWPAALRIVEACRSAWRAAKTDLGRLPAFLELFTEYVSTEVLSGVDEPLVEFLAASSIVEVIEPGLASALVGSEDGRRHLEALVSSNSVLYTTGAKDGAWRLPTLLRLILRRRLESRGAPYLQTLHSRAGAWYESQGRILEATRHYVAAGRADIAAALVERAGPATILLREGDDHAAAVLRLIPDEQLAATPRIALCRAFLDFKQGFLKEARHKYEEISRCTAGFTKDREGGDDAQLAAEAVFYDLTMQFYQQSSVSHSFLRSMEERLVSSAKEDVRLHLIMQLVLALLYQLRGDLDRAHSGLLEAERLSARLSSRWMMVWMRHHFGALALARGHLHEARHQLQIGLKTWRRDFRYDLSYRALSYILLAEIDYELDALSEAQSKIDEALYSVEHVEGWYELYASVYETASMLALHKEGPERALMLLNRAEGVLRIRELLRNFLPTMRMRIAAVSGDIRGAREIAAKSRLEEIWSGPASQDQLSRREWDLIGLTLCQVAIETGELDRASEILDRIQAQVRRSGRLRSEVRAHLLRADVRRGRGDLQGAVQSLRQALETGSAQGYVRVFLDEAGRLRSLLDLLDGSSERSLPPHLEVFAARLGRALPGDRPPPKSPGLLSARERDVLHELSLGHSNKLIARKLGVSEATVKFHVQNVFRKLDVRRRTSAVAEAHRRGLLA